MLSSLWRGLLHGDSSATGSTPITSWELRTSDLTAMPVAYMHLYADSFGALYTDQLNKHTFRRCLGTRPRFMIEPEPCFSALVSKPYLDLYNFTFMPIYAAVATICIVPILTGDPKVNKIGKFNT
jgi:hypothetical protein